jgi:hypothetical protein
MTQTATPPHAGNVPRRLADRIARLQRQLSDRIFAGRDAFAREHGWQITKTTGRLGFGARSYHDPRFGQRAAAARQGPDGTGRRPDARSG